MTTPRPDTGAGSQLRLRQLGQMGTGGCTKVAQSVQRWMRRRPSAPDVQNHSFAGVSSGRGLTVGTTVDVDVNIGIRQYGTHRRAPLSRARE